MSDQEIVVTKRRANRLNLDSEEEARLQEEERQREEQIRLKKQQKRRRREQEAKRAQEQEKRRIQLQRHYEDPQTMLQPDSNSNDHFQRAQKKIKKAYPQYHSKRRQSSQSQEQESQQQSDEESQSEEESSRPKKKKAQKNVKNSRKQRRKQESQEVRAPRQKVQKVKVQEKDPKEKLVGQVAIRWWYCLPEWPPADYDYEGQLKKLGYRLVQSNRFRMQENLVNGLFKATTVDGYVGVFKTKQKIIDIRPKQNCPSLQFLRSKSMTQLTNLLKTALKQQISQLTNQQFQGNGDLQLIEELTRQLNLLNE